MYVLKGTRTLYEYCWGGWTGQTSIEEEDLATFDEYKDAQKYINNPHFFSEKAYKVAWRNLRSIYSASRGISCF